MSISRFSEKAAGAVLPAVCTRKYIINTYFGIAFRGVFTLDNHTLLIYNSIMSIDVIRRKRQYDRDISHLYR